MPKNLELKAALASPKEAATICRRIHATRKGLLRQVDTYFVMKKGRLKLREINGRKFELIYYRREDSKKSRYSDYQVVPISEPRTMKELCVLMLGLRAVVKKKRILYVYKNARIHIDSVDGLGSFIEFEVIVNHGKRQARQIMDFLVSTFSIVSKSVVAGSYVDLIFGENAG